VEEADALLLLGVILSDTNFALSQRGSIRAGPCSPSTARCGSATTFIRCADRRSDRGACDARAPARGRQRACGLRAIEYPRGLKADDGPIAPSDIAAAINDLFDRHGPMPMTADMGDCLFTAMEIENTALAAPGYYAGMGFGVPAGIGVAAATGVAR
jgi:indolepyruvate decarboxylase